ncbi:MAG: hypothetical protein QXK12_04360 [Candidatus Nezhaarchaeales archaeon]
MPRRLIPISEDVVNELIRVAEREGVPVRDLAEAMLKDALKGYRLMGGIGKALEEIEVLNEFKRAGGMMLPARVFYEILELMDEGSLFKLKGEVRKVFSWYGSILKNRGSHGSFKSSLLSILGVALWDMRLEVKVDGDVVKVLASSPLQPAKATAIALEAVTSLLTSIGFNVLRTHIDEGVIVVEAKEEKPSG